MVVTDTLSPADPPAPLPAALQSLVHLDGVALPALVCLPPLDVTRLVCEQIALLADEGASFDGAFVKLPCPPEDHGDELLVRADAIRAILPHRPAPPARGQRPGQSGPDGHVQRAGI